MTVALGSIPASSIRVCWANADPTEAAGFETYWKPLGPESFRRIEGGMGCRRLGRFVQSGPRAHTLEPGTRYTAAPTWRPSPE